MKKCVISLNIIFTILILIGDIFYINFDYLVIKGITSAGFVLLGIINLVYLIKNKNNNLNFGILMLIGLIFAMCGDIFLNINFISGAVLFAIGHIFYFASYCSIIKFKILDLIVGIIIFIPACIFIIFAPIFEFDGNIIKWVCVIYALIISCMTGKSICNFIKQKNILNMLLMIGSILFCFSDLMLLLDVFANLNSVVGILCLATYYPAQIILAHSIMHAGDKI